MAKLASNTSLAIALSTYRKREDINNAPLFRERNRALDEPGLSSSRRELKNTTTRVVFFNSGGSAFREAKLELPFFEEKTDHRSVHMQSIWRKREDSNLRDISAHTISSRAPSTTRPRFHLLFYHNLIPITHGNQL